MDRRIVLLIFLFVGIGQSLDWTPAEDILNAGVKSGVYPGCTALVGNKTGIIWQKGFGNYTYGLLPPYPINGQNPPDNVDTLFDLASCTKIVGATQAIAQFYQRGELDLYTKVGDIIGKDFNAKGKESITVINCLLHNAGFPPDPSPNYYQPGPLECPQTKQFYPQEDFSCSQIIWERLTQQTLINPVGAVYIYSDLSFITLSYVVGNLARNLGYINASQTIPGCIQPNIDEEANDRCYFEAYVHNYVHVPLGMMNTGFLPPKNVWQDCTPTDNDTTYRHFLPQGQVSDQNAYSMGGISGHAGIFSNLYDLHILLNRTLFATENDTYLNSTTVKYFTTEYNHSQSSRALGWDTNDPTVNDYGWDQSCGHLFSPKTYMHLGYTGTIICADPDREIYSVLLTNRVYLNNTKFSSTGIHDIRTSFGDAVVEILDADKTPEERAIIRAKREAFFKKKLAN